MSAAGHVGKGALSLMISRVGFLISVTSAVKRFKESLELFTQFSVIQLDLGLHQINSSLV